MGEKPTVREVLGDRTICQHCGANIETYADRCSAPLEFPCEGFRRIETAANAIADGVPENAWGSPA